VQLCRDCQDQVSQEHWFSLGPPARRVARRPGVGLLERVDVRVLKCRCWSCRIMKTTLLRSNVQGGRPAANQVRPTARCSMGCGPNSGYNRTDVHLNYQYRAFGVPGLRFEAGLAEDLVIAPLCHCDGTDGCGPGGLRQPRTARRRRREGPYGFYEAVDLYPVHVFPLASPASPSARSWPIIRA